MTTCTLFCCLISWFAIWFTLLHSPTGDIATSDATTCAIGDAAAACGVDQLSEGPPSPCGDGIEAILLKLGIERPEERESHNSNNLLILRKGQVHSDNACHIEPDPELRSVRQDHQDHDVGVFEAELRKGSKPPGAGQPSPVHNSVTPDSEILNQVDAALELRKEPSGGRHGQELSANNEHGGDSFVTVLAQNTGRPGAGSPSQGHNSLTDGVASE